MWLELVDHNGTQVAMNVDNIVRMNTLEKTGYTELWSTVARPDILTRLRTRGANAQQLARK